MDEEEEEKKVEKGVTTYPLIHVGPSSADDGDEGEWREGDETVRVGGGV